MLASDSSGKKRAAGFQRSWKKYMLHWNSSFPFPDVITSLDIQFIVKMDYCVFDIRASRGAGSCSGSYFVSCSLMGREEK